MPSMCLPDWSGNRQLTEQSLTSRTPYLSIILASSLRENWPQSPDSSNGLKIAPCRFPCWFSGSSDGSLAQISSVLRTQLDDSFGRLAFAFSKMHSSELCFTYMLVDPIWLGGSRFSSSAKLRVACKK